MKFALACLQAALLAAGLLLSYSQAPSLAFGSESRTVSLTPLFPAPTLPPVLFDQPILASPLLDFSQGKPLLVVAAANGEIAMLDAETGVPDWKLQAPAPEASKSNWSPRRPSPAAS